MAEEAGSSWKLCTVTLVDELKNLLRLPPIWVTSIIMSSVYTQMNTTLIQQGSAMNMSILSVPLEAASMGSFEVIVTVLRGFSSGGDGEPSQLQCMGAGRLLMALAMAISALVEMKRLDSAERGEEITIAWQLPLYFFLAGACSAKSTCTSLALPLLTMA
ncbi:unnamed protein product [Miscanthus lutarioriparius]|uniref:Uncharacterized protein n=1 Tax=Miscanthus lutarioriparius TaxID=422564 RepID=A0A811PDG6_9POAL|nr:unnamed protein product [Miscanthus lutarioriparius]